MGNLFFTIIYIKTNVLQDFHICISLTLRKPDNPTQVTD